MTELLVNKAAAPTANPRDAPPWRASRYTTHTQPLLSSQLTRRPTRNGRSPTSSMTVPSTKAQYGVWMYMKSL